MATGHLKTGRWSVVDRANILPSLVLLIFGVAMLVPRGAHAAIFICKDAAGRTLTSDHPMPECAIDRPVRELDHSGVTVREIAPPLTAQQKREREAAEEKQRVVTAKLEEQRLYDSALITRYRNQSDIALARQRAVSLLEEQMQIDTKALPAEMTEMKAAQAAMTANTKPGPAIYLKRRLDESTRVVERRLSAIEARTAEIERTNKKFDQAVKRFSELTLAADAPKTPPPTLKPAPNPASKSGH